MNVGDFDKSNTWERRGTYATGGGRRQDTTRRKGGRRKDKKAGKSDGTVKRKTPSLSVM